MKDVFSVKHTTTVNLHRISINACCSERNVRNVANLIKSIFSFYRMYSMFYLFNQYVLFIFLLFICKKYIMRLHLTPISNKFPRILPFRTYINIYYWNGWPSFMRSCFLYLSSFLGNTSMWWVYMYEEVKSTCILGLLLLPVRYFPFWCTRWYYFFCDKTISQQRSVLFV